MLAVILLGVLSVLFFLCISNVGSFSRPIRSGMPTFSNLGRKYSDPAPPHRFRIVTLLQGVIKAIGTVFGERPTGRKVTEPAAIALMTSRFLRGFGGVIRLRIEHRTFI
jgi:hypothetical protein